MKTTEKIVSRMKIEHVDGLMIDRLGNVRAVGRHGTITFPTAVEFEQWINGDLRIRSASFVEFNPTLAN